MLVLVVKMATVLEEYITKEQHSVVRFYGQMDSMQWTFINKCFLFIVGSVCRIWIQKFSQECLKSWMGPDKVWKWLRKQSKDLCSAGFDALVK
jgi:hypothetical protein